MNVVLLGRSQRQTKVERTDQTDTTGWAKWAKADDVDSVPRRLSGKTEIFHLAP